MDDATYSRIVSFLWGIADDCLRDLYVRGTYRDVILPMTVIRRLDAVLEATKPAVLDMKKMLDDAGVVHQDQALRQAAEQAFYNTSKFTLRDLKNRAKREQLEADFRDYLDGLGKPIERVLVTHAHPDHWLTLATFKDHPTYAFREAIDEMAFLKDLAVGYHKSIHPEDPDLVPNEVVLPANTIEPGTLTVDGVDLVLHKLLDAEATATMLVELPAIATLLANDLVYDHCYLYVATK